MKKKKSNILIDSRNLKIVAAKKDQLKNALVFICLNEQKYGQVDKMGLRKIAEQLEAIEPDAVYFPVTKDMNVQIFDKNDFRNKKLLVTINHSDAISNDQVDDQIKQAIPEAQSITVIHADVNIQEK